MLELANRARLPLQVGATTLAVLSLEGQESLSEPFHLQSEVLANVGLNSACSIGQPGLATLIGRDGRSRSLAGVVTEVQEQGRHHDGRPRVRLRLESGLALLRCQHDQRMILGQSVDELARELLLRHGFTLQQLEINRERVRQAIALYEKDSGKPHKAALGNSDLDYVVTLIAQSPSYSMVNRWAPHYVVGRKLGFLGAATSDTLAGLERSGVSLFSMVIGNAVGLVETRKGKLSRRGGLADQLREGLRAGDILLEKTPFRLTDILIPGYWGHAVVWVGSEQEFRDLG